MSASVKGGPGDGFPGGFDAETYLNSLVPIGWKLGLERMNLLSDELGRPQDRFDSIHVVGTNGKSSVTRMTGSIITAHGHRTGCSLSPHLTRWSERVVVDGKEIDPVRFSRAVEQTARAAEAVNATLENGEVVTQFEVATAAAFLALAEAGVELAVIEAGLGGRLDATNSIDSLATVLTSIGLDHTEFLGETEREIAAEKLAVLRPGTALVLGTLAPEVDALAVETAAARNCRVIRPAAEPGPELASAGGFQQRNFAVARAAAEVWLGTVEEEATARAAAGLVIPGRLEKISESPPTFVDVAHNRSGAAALAGALPEVAGDGPVIACIAALADKDAVGMLAELRGSVDRAVFTELPAAALEAWGRPGARSWPARDLLAAGEDLGMQGEVEPEPAAAIARARELARELGGSVIVAGSHFLLASGGPPDE
ncbi:MAG: bifunctional folylpolyglutamate synthase/dihydrofolate synthase [Actinomycetota bacterium]|nr:bifunctional folylpolyglutamate synthase/dihydrofolate synthase [Actinomycetota bacterium]